MRVRPIARTLTTGQLLAAVEQLEGHAVDANTLSVWAQTGLVVPSVEYPERRGSGRIYSLDDLARVRLIMRLKQGGLSTQRIRIVFAQLGDELAEMLRPNTKVVLAVDRRTAILKRPGQADREIPGGQLRLPLVEVVKGNAKVAAALAA
jgi:DNA-binding transcriptional MerR regulator